MHKLSKSAGKFKSLKSCSEYHHFIHSLCFSRWKIWKKNVLFWLLFWGENIVSHQLLLSGQMSLTNLWLSKFASEPLPQHLSSVFYRLLCPPYISIDVLLTFRLLSLLSFLTLLLQGKFCSGSRRKSVVDVILPWLPRECQLSY